VSLSSSQRPATTRPSPPGLSVTDVRRLWPEVLEEVKGRRRFTWVLLSQNAHVADVSEGRLLLAMPNAGARDSFAKSGNPDILREALVVVLGVDLEVSAMVDPSAGAGSRPPSRERSVGGSPAPPRERSVGGSPAPPRELEGSGSSDRPSGAPGQGGRDAGAEASRPRGAEPQPEDVLRPARVDEAVLEQARQAIRPTRNGPRTAGDHHDDRDTAADRNDAEVDESEESHTELLARQLGAQIIAEEEHGT
jgi:DNA polymerase-3 subunit gamma/tau